MIFSLVNVDSIPGHLAEAYQGLIRANERLLLPDMADRHLSQRAIEYFAVYSPYSWSQISSLTQYSLAWKKRSSVRSWDLY